MKNLIASIILLLASFSTLLAQTPQGVNYQAALRDGNGDIMANQAVTIRLTIELTTGGSNIYRETHAVNTNEFGLVNLVLGQGTVVLGTFSTINWNQQLNLQIEVNDGGGYVDMGTSPLESVPYALRSDKALNMELKDLTNVAAATPVNGEVLKFNGTNWIPQMDNNTTYTAGAGISINGSNSIINTGDTNANDDLTTITSLGGDVNGFYNNLQLLSNTVGNAEMMDNAIGTNEIMDNAITAAKIPPDAIGSQEITFDAVGSSEIANNAVTSTELMDGAVTTTKIADGSITNSDINVAAGITYGKLSLANSITAADIANDAVANSEIASNAVGSAEIIDGSITAADLGQMSAITNEVLKWNGTAWAPADDNSGSGGSYSAGNGISIASNTINSVWTQSGNNIFNNTIGNIGLGTSTSLSQRLNIDGGLSLSGSIYNRTDADTRLLWSPTVVELDVDGLSMFSCYNQDGTDNDWMWLAPDADVDVRVGDYSLFVEADNENVGIGTWVPGATFHISDNATFSTPHLRVTETASGQPIRIQFDNADASGTKWINSIYCDELAVEDSYYRFTFNDGLSTNILATLNGIGNFGIGTSTPETSLEVNGAITMDDEAVTQGAGTTTIIDPANRTYFRITATQLAATHGLEILDGSAIGQILIIECAGTLITMGWTLIDEDLENIEIGGDYVMSAEDTITLIWNGTLWVEIARSNN